MRIQASLVGILIWFAAAAPAQPVYAAPSQAPSVPSKIDNDVQRLLTAMREPEASQHSASAPTTPDEQLYAKTITTMRDLPEPPYLTFVFNVTLRGEISTALLENHGFVVFRIWSGKGKGKGQPSGSWATSHRASDDLGSVANAPQSHLLAKSPIFNPTWTGAYDWLRFGIEGPPRIPKSSPQPSTESEKQLKTIGYVKALGPSAYRITGANPAVCPGGQEGRRLQLAAQRGDVWVHPLTEVTIDLASARFCSMRFHSPVNGAGGVSFAELHFRTVNGYWVTTKVDTDWRDFGQFGIGGHRAEWHITYDEMRFPDTLDDALFRLPAGTAELTTARRAPISPDAAPIGFENHPLP